MSIRSVFAGIPFCVSAASFIHKHLAIPLKMSIWRFIVNIVRSDVYRLVQCTTVHWDVGRAIDVRTVMNIENYKANPKMEVLFPLIRTLRVDARTIFNPELERDAPIFQQLRLMVEECSEQEAEALIPVVESVIAALRAKDAIEIG